MSQWWGDNVSDHPRMSPAAALVPSQQSPLAYDCTSKIRIVLRERHLVLLVDFGKAGEKVATGLGPAYAVGERLGHPILVAHHNAGEADFRVD
jgi:hypothetical protein